MAGYLGRQTTLNLGSEFGLASGIQRCTPVAKYSESALAVPNGTVSRYRGVGPNSKRSAHDGISEETARVSSRCIPTSHVGQISQHLTTSRNQPAQPAQSAQQPAQPALPVQPSSPASPCFLPALVRRGKASGVSLKSELPGDARSAATGSEQSF